MNKTRIINLFFILLITIYFISKFTFFYDYEGIIYTIGLSLYLIGFCIWAISNLKNNKSSKTLVLYSIMCIISVIMNFIYLIDKSFITAWDINSIEIKLFRPDLYVSCLLITNIIYKLLLFIISINNIRNRKCKMLAYILILTTYVLNILNLFNENFAIQDLIFIFISLYISIYVYYFNKDGTSTNFKNSTSIKIFKKIIIIMAIIVFILLIVFKGNLISLIRLKIDLNNLNSKYATSQSTNNLCIVGSFDGKKHVRITPSNKFKKTPNIIYYNDVKINNGPLSLKVNDITDSIFLFIGIDKSTVSKIHDSKQSSITYNNKKYAIYLPTIWQAICTTKNQKIEIATPIDSECFYCISISLDNYKYLKIEDLESLLSFQIIN